MNKSESVQVRSKKTKPAKIKPKKTILIAAGGTGGHVFPGIAIAHEFQSRGYNVEWLGTEAGLESRLVPVNGIKLNFFPAQGIRGKGAMALLLAPLRILRSIAVAMGIVRKRKPVLVVGMGGFVSGPVCAAAFLLNIPVVIHEQNAVPGTSNKLLAKIAKKTLCAFPVALPGAIVIGNPVRESLETIKPSATPNLKEVKVLVLGGSRGARALNTQLPQAFVAAGIEERISVMHQCGSGREQETIEAYADTNTYVEVCPFIDDMDAALAWADVMVCRAGALTVSEIAVVGLPAIFIPYPYAIDDHQTQNAHYLADVGAAEIVQETEFKDGHLDAALRNVITNATKMESMATAAKAAGKHGVARCAVALCEEVLL